MLVFGDNLQVMKSLLDLKKRGKLCNADGSPGVRLVYIDPPFATKQEFRGSEDQKAYQDKVGGESRFGKNPLVRCSGKAYMNPVSSAQATNE